MHDVPALPVLTRWTLCSRFDLHENRACVPMAWRLRQPFQLSSPCWRHTPEPPRFPSWDVVVASSEILISGCVNNCQRPPLGVCQTWPILAFSGDSRLTEERQRSDGDAEAGWRANQAVRCRCPVQGQLAGAFIAASSSPQARTLLLRRLLSSSLAACSRYWCSYCGETLLCWALTRRRRSEMQDVPIWCA